MRGAVPSIMFFQTTVSFQSVCQSAFHRTAENGLMTSRSTSIVIPKARSSEVIISEEHCSPRHYCGLCTQTLICHILGFRSSPLVSLGLFNRYRFINRSSHYTAFKTKLRNTHGQARKSLATLMCYFTDMLLGTSQLTKHVEKCTLVSQPLLSSEKFKALQMPLWSECHW